MSTTTTGPRVRAGFVNLSVQVKIVVATAVGVAMAVVVGVLALLALGDAKKSAKHIYTHNVRNVGGVGAIEAALGTARVDLANQLISRDTATTARYTKKFEDDVALFEAALAAYRAGDPAAPGHGRRRAAGQLGHLRGAGPDPADPER